MRPPPAAGGNIPAAGNIREKQQEIYAKNIQGRTRQRPRQRGLSLPGAPASAPGGINRPDPFWAAPERGPPLEVCLAIMTRHCSPRMRRAGPDRGWRGPNAARPISSPMCTCDEYARCALKYAHLGVGGCVEGPAAAVGPIVPPRPRFSLWDQPAPAAPRSHPRPRREKCAR